MLTIHCPSTATKGISANLLQSGSKRRRTKAQIEAEKEEAMVKEQSIQAKLAQYDILQEKVRIMEQDHASGQMAASLMTQFIDSGAIQTDGQGNYKVQNQDEEQSFRAFAEQQ